MSIYEKFYIHYWIVYDMFYYLTRCVSISFGLTIAQLVYVSSSVGHLPAASWIVWAAIESEKKIIRWEINKSFALRRRN